MSTKPHQKGQTTHAAHEVNIDRVLPLIRSKIDRSSEPADCVRQIQGKAERAANAANEIAQMIRYSHETPNDELAFLLRVATFFDSLSRAMGAERKRAKIMEHRKKKEREAQLEQDIRNLGVELFGASPEPESIMSMAADFIDFCNSADDYLKAKHGVAFGVLPVFCSTFKLEGAVGDGNLTSIARCLTLLRMEMKDTGQAWTAQSGEHGYIAGWADFIEYRNCRRVTL